MDTRLPQRIAALDSQLRAIFAQDIGPARATPEPGRRGEPAQIAYYWDLARRPTEDEAAHLAALPIGIQDWEADGYSATAYTASPVRVHADI